MAQGWICLHRSLSDHWLWESSEPFDRRSAWIDLLLMANYKDFKAERKGRIVYRKRGEVNVSTRYLADRWHWSRGRVNRFLALLESDNMVTLNSTTDGTTIIVENYSKWQDAQATDDTTDSTTDDTTDGTTDSTTHSTTGGTNDNNINNINNINKANKGNKRGRFTPPTLSEVDAYVKEKGYHFDAETFIAFYASKGWMVGKTKMVSWKHACATWEKRKAEERPQKRPASEWSVEDQALIEELFGE